MPGIEPGAFHMQSERSTTELHPPDNQRINLVLLSNFVKDVNILNIQLLRCNPFTVLQE